MALWLLVILAIQLALTKYGPMTDTPVAPEERAFMAMAQAVAIGIGYLAILFKQGVRRAGFAIERNAKPAFVLLASWTIIVGVATFGGAYANNETYYVLGDCYRFLLLPLIFGLAYFGLETRKDLDLVLEGTILVLGGMFMVDFFRYLPFVLAGNRFETGASFYAHALVPLIIYLLFRRGNSGLFTIVAYVVAAEILVSSVLVQGFTDYAVAIITIALFLFYWRKVRLLVAGTLALGITFIGIMKDPFGVFGGASYGYTKLDYAMNAPSLYASVARLVGARLLQIQYIGQLFQEFPQRIPLGFGMGAMMEANLRWAALYGIWWRRWQHVVESGLAEIAYRAGLLALLVFLLFLWHVFRRGRRLASGPHREYGIFVMVNTISIAAAMSLVSTLPYVSYILAISLAGTFVLERASLAIEAHRPVPRLQKRPGGYNGPTMTRTEKPGRAPGLAG